MTFKKAFRGQIVSGTLSLNVVVFSLVLHHVEWCVPKWNIPHLPAIRRFQKYFLNA